MTTGRAVEPGVTYPRELDRADYEGLPEGWKVFEYAYKSGQNMGKTYVRFNSATKKENLCTLRQAVKKAALYRGMSEEDAEQESTIFHQSYLANKARIQKEKQKEKEASGASKVKGEQRDEAIAAFRAKYGPLDGGTVCQMPGWRAESLWRESCQQLAVSYYNEGNVFNLLKDIEAFLGLRVLKGLDCEEVNVARSKVVTNESGKAVNVARLKADMARLADGQDVVADGAGADVPVLARKRRRGCASPLPLLASVKYVEHAMLAVLPVPVAGVDDHSAIAETWAKAEKTAEEMGELRASATKIHRLLVSRGFAPEVKLLGLHGCEPSYRFADVLQGILYEMPGAGHNGRACFQKVCLSAEGVLSCEGLYIFWETMQQEWRIGSLRTELVPLATAVGKGDTPAEAGHRWRILAMEDEIKKEAPADAEEG